VRWGQEWSWLEGGGYAGWASFLSYMQVSMLLKLFLYGHENMKVWIVSSKSMSVYCTVGRVRLGKAKSGKRYVSW